MYRAAANVRGHTTDLAPGTSAIALAALAPDAQAQLATVATPRPQASPRIEEGPPVGRALLLSDSRSEDPTRQLVAGWHR
jgi:hypothetical protein